MAKSAVMSSVLSHLPSCAQHHVHFVMGVCHRGANLAMSAQGVRPRDKPCLRKGTLPSLCLSMQQQNTHYSVSERCQDSGIPALVLFLTSTSITNICPREGLCFLFTDETEVISAGSCCCQENTSLLAGRLLSPSNREVFSLVMTSGGHSNPPYLLACGSHKNCFRGPSNVC